MNISSIFNRFEIPFATINQTINNPTITVPTFETKPTLEDLRGRISANPNYQISDTELKTILDTVGTLKSFFKDQSIITVLKEMNKGQLKKVLEAWILQNIDKPQRYLDLLNILNDSDLIYKVSSDEIIEKKINEQAELTETALKSVINLKAKAIYKRILPEIWHMSRKIFHDMVSQFGFFDLEERQGRRWGGGGSRYEAEQSVMLYKQLFYLYPIALYEIISSCITSVVLSVIGTTFAVCVTIFALSFYIKYMRICPKYTDGLENLTYPKNYDNPTPVVGRDEIYTRIKTAWESGKGVLLIGSAGAGKTKLANGLAQKCLSGEMGETFKKIQIFKCAAADFMASDYNSPTLSSITATFEHHKNEVAFFFDEIASAFEKDGIVGQNHHTAKSLLTFHDTFHYMICATTKKEFDEFINNGNHAPFLRRFAEVIELQPLNQEQLETALYDHIDKEAPQLILEDNVIDYISKKACEFQQNTSQIDAAISLLSAALVKLKAERLDALEAEISRLKSNIAHQERTYCHSSASSMLSDSKSFDTSPESPQAQLKVKEKELNQKINQFNDLKRVESVYLKWKLERLLLGNKIKKQNIKGKNGEWLKRLLAEEALEKIIKQKRKALGLPAWLDKDLIDSILAQKA